jgi:hypothetical protein
MMRLNSIITFLLVSLVWLPCAVRPHNNSQADKQDGKQKAGERLQAGRPESEREREIAARFAPVFHQAIGDRRRSDFITNFDFDGDWRGDNNWAHAEDPRFPLKAYVYYSVSETATHYFIHYAVFHAQDYKGGREGARLSQIIREGTRLGSKYDPTGLAEEITLAHENDMEGCLVVATKKGDDLKNATVSFVETLAHGKFLKFVAEGSSVSGFRPFATEGQQPQLYIEPKGHGIMADENGEKKSSHSDMLTYRFTGHAENPEEKQEGTIGYELVSIYSTLWEHAHDAPNQTYGAAYKYSPLTVNVALKSSQASTRKITEGSLGSAFRGSVGATNAARPPWSWFDKNDRTQPPGAWFFDPATTIKRHFNLSSDFSVAYLSAPFIGISRQ